MKHILLFVFLFATSIVGFAENWDDIITSSAYYYGEGSGTTKELVEKDALSALIGSISNHVKSSFKSIGEDVNADGEVSSSLKLESCIKTYSELRLSNVQKFPTNKRGEDFVARCYIKRSEVERIFCGACGKGQGYD